MNLQSRDLRAFFEKRGCAFETGYGVNIVMTNEGWFWTACKLPDLLEMPASLRVVTDEESAHSFIEGFRLQQTEDILRISYNYLWMRYLNGEAVFYALLPGWEQEIGFRLLQGRTIVFCKTIHFYDEQDRHLTMPDEFFGYIKKNKKLLQTMRENAKAMTAAATIK